MRRENVFKLISFILLLILLGIIFLLGKRIWLAGMEKKIVQSMKIANYCATSNDCALVMYGCPFGCGAYINKKETAQISKRVSSYFRLQAQLRVPGCVYDCASRVPPVCQQGKCVSKPCALNKEYKANFPDNCSCPPGSFYVSKPASSGQAVFACVEGKR